jgi:hypothetical protein
MGMRRTLSVTAATLSHEYIILQKEEKVFSRKKEEI